MAVLDGKVAIITGGARGMGLGHAEEFLRQGARVVIADVLGDEVRETADALGANARGAELDVRREDGWRQLVSFTLAEFGPPTILVNNAGVASYGRLVELSEEEYRRVIDINQLGVFLGMKAVAPAMIEAGGGSIVNIASVEGLVGGPGLLAYAASKHAVLGMTKVAALELASLGVRVNAVAPGPVDTPMMDAVAAKGVDVHAAAAAASPLGRMARPEEITSVVVFLASDQSSYCTGSTISVDGGWVAR